MTTLSNNGYILLKKNYSADFIKEIKDELKVKPKVQDKYTNEEPESFCLFQENKNKLYLPRYYGVKKMGQEEKNKLNEGCCVSYDFDIVPRDYQQKALDIIMKKIYTIGGGILHLPPAYGKTFLALKIAHSLGLRTLVIVHADFLLNQWVTKINAYSNASIGIIKQNKVEIEDTDIVIGMLQSISKNKYPKEIFSSFGLIIVDECHHISANKFSTALKIIRPKYTIGLTATPYRKDGLTKVFKWFLGETIYKDIIQIKNNVIVEIFEHDELIPVKNFRGFLNIPKMITDVANIKSRNEIIINIVKRLVKNDRNILILSERRKHTIELKKTIDKLNICTTGLYIGAMKQNDLDNSMNKKIILGTYSMISEAFDNDRLNTLILATPKSDVVQIIGRILRKEHGKKNAIVIDIVDNALKHQFYARKKYYDRQKYKIVNEITDEKIDEKQKTKENDIICKCLF